MRTQAELNGIAHEDVTVCECDDIHCTCGGSCRLEAKHTSYETDDEGHDSEVSHEFCADCAWYHFEFYGWQTDDN